MTSSRVLWLLVFPLYILAVGSLLLLWVVSMRNDEHAMPAETISPPPVCIAHIAHAGEDSALNSNDNAVMLQAL
jgi:hypothetical protein